MNRQKALVCAAAAFLTLCLASCEEAKSTAPTPLPVRAANVESIRSGNAVKYSATIVPYSQVDLSFKSNGYVERILQVNGSDGRRRNVDQGDFVKRGTVLALVSQQDYLDKLNQAKAQLFRAQADYDKAKERYQARLRLRESPTRQQHRRCRLGQGANQRGSGSVRLLLPESAVRRLDHKTHCGCR